MSRQFISLGDDRIQRARQMLVGFENQLGKVMARAVNRATENARSNVVREVRDHYNVKAGDIRKSMKISRAKAGRPVAVLSSTGSALPTMAFQVRPGTVNGKRRTPIRVSIKKGESTLMERSFIARVNGRIGVYERIGKKRMPIRQLYGPSIPQMVGNERIVESVAESAREMLDSRLDHEINRILDGAR